MPVKQHMSWTKQKRWQKRYKGKLYGVSPRQLECPPTKEGSRVAANAWWEQKKAELDRDTNLQSREWQDFIDGERELVELGAERNMMFALGRLHEREERRAEVKARGQTIGDHIAAFVRGKRAEVDAKEISAGRYDAYRRHAEYFRDWVGMDEGAECLDSAKMVAYLDHLRGMIGERDRWEETREGPKQGMSRWEAKGKLDTAVSFVKHLWELGLIELPRKIGSRKYRISVGDTPNQSIDLDIARILAVGNAEASERTRLYVLLMLNCGYQQSDIANLAPHEVDWTEGRIIRKRCKTRKNKHAPEVDYKLWPETLALLSQYRSDDPLRVLVSEKGKPLWEEWIRPDGRKALRDDIRNAYRRYCKSLKIEPRPPMKAL